MNPFGQLLDLVTLRFRRLVAAPEPGQPEAQTLDFVNPVLQLDKVQFSFSSPPVLVSQELEGRPHLISKLVYGSEDYADILMQVNGIQNPLRVEAGQVLIVPDLAGLLAGCVDARSLPEPGTPVAQQQRLISKLGIKDATRVQSLIKKANPKADPTDIRTPNMVKPNTSPLTPANGRVVLGTGISDARCRDDLSTTQTMTENVRKAVQAKIRDQAAQAQVADSPPFFNPLPSPPQLAT